MRKELTRKKQYYDRFKGLTYWYEYKRYRLAVREEKCNAYSNIIFDNKSKATWKIVKKLNKYC